jgi:acetyl esterase/lipase
MGTGSPKGFNSPVPISLLKSCNNTFNRAFSLSYRLSSSYPFEPTNPFPAALLDALAGYRYLTQTIGFSPDNIILSGDSAGGHLALSLVTYLAETSDQLLLPVPGALVLLSPFADLGRSHDVASESRPVPSMLRNANTDFSLPFYKSGYSTRSVLGVLPHSLLQNNRYLSPASLHLSLPPGQFAGFPPTFIVAGGEEVLLDSIRTLRDRMKADIGEGGKNGVVYAEYEHANHDFLTVEWHEPERSDVLRALAGWLENLGSNQEVA